MNTVFQVVLFNERRTFYLAEVPESDLVTFAMEALGALYQHRRRFPNLVATGMIFDMEKCGWGYVRANPVEGMLLENFVTYRLQTPLEMEDSKGEMANA